MAKAIKFYKKICVLATAAVLVCGSPLSAHATGNAADPDAEITEEADSEDSDEDPEEEPEDEPEDSGDENIGNSGNSGSGSDSSDGEDGEESDEDEDNDGVVTNRPQNSDEELEGVDVLDEDHPSGILMIDPDADDAISAGGSSSGNGVVRITTIKRPKNVVSMIVPILDRINYDFVLDPEGLLPLNPDNTIIGGESTLYFRSNESDSTYSIFAEVATAINKSTVPVQMTIDLSVIGAAENGINLTDLSGVYSAEEPSMCMAILPTEIGTVREGESADDLPILKSGMSMIDSDGHAYKEMIIPGSIDNFELVTLPTSERDVYVQEYRPLDDAQWSAAGFTLYGACSRETDWSGVVKSLKEGGSISFTLTYNIEPVYEEEGED